MSWYSRCKKIIGKLLTKIGEEDNINKYFSKDYEKLWKKCFTHISKDDVVNYERVEFLGDALLGFIFPLYLHQHKDYKNAFSEGEKTELKRVYMSKHKQPDLARKLGINKLLIYNSVLGDYMTDINSILEDIYESFFATLYEIAENNKRGTGINVTYKMLEYNLKDIDIIKEEGKGGSKNRVDQTFQIIASFSRPADRLTYKDDDDMYVFKLSVPAKAKQILRDNNILLPEIIGEAKSKTKKEAKNKAYDDALNTILEFGLDKDKALEIKSLTLLDKINDDRLKYKFTNKLNKEGFDYFQLLDQTLYTEDEKTLYLFYLYGIKINKSKERLAFDYSEMSISHELELLNLMKTYTD